MVSFRGYVEFQGMCISQYTSSSSCALSSFPLIKSILWMNMYSFNSNYRTICVLQLQDLQPQKTAPPKSKSVNLQSQDQCWNCKLQGTWQKLRQDTPVCRDIAQPSADKTRGRHDVPSDRLKGWDDDLRVQLGRWSSSSIGGICDRSQEGTTFLQINK